MTSQVEGKPKHVCNTTNIYYKYCKENHLPLIALPSDHCIWCGDVLND